MAAKDAIEESVVLLQLTAERIGHQITAAPVRADLRADPVHEHEPFWLSHRQPAEKELVEQRKDGRVRADSQCQRQDCGDREAGTAQERAHGVP